MPKIFTQLEKTRVSELAETGLRNTEIATQMTEEFPDNWNISSGPRAVARILKEANVGVNDTSKTLDEMTREQRYIHIESTLRTTSRYRMALKTFSDDERTVFCDEYLSIVKSTDTLTEVEEQALFAAILELVLALKSLARKEQEEDFYARSMAGTFTQEDPQYRRFVDDKYQKEYDQHMKLHQKGISNLKMSREQRLKEVRTDRRTLVDLAEDFSTKNAQAEVADEIERLSKLRDEQLQKMLDDGSLHGTFDD